MLPMVAINLLLKIKIRCQSLGLRWKYMPCTIPKYQPRSGRRSIGFGDLKSEVHRCVGSKQNRYLGTETDVLSSLTNIESEGGFLKP